MGDNSNNCQLQLEKFIVKMDLPEETPKLHKTANTYRWRDALEYLLDTENNDDFELVYKNAIKLPNTGIYEYNFNTIYKYPIFDTFDYITVVDVSYLTNTSIFIGVKNKLYYKVHVENGCFNKPFVYELDIDDYVYV